MINEKLNQKLKAAEYAMMNNNEDGRTNIGILNLHLAPGSKILETGTGPGKDLGILREKHRVTGSDISKAFLDMAGKNHPDLRLLLLDAVSLEIDEKFDCIYSNKVLHQLSRKELTRSFERQFELLNPGGLLCHSFWYGDKEVIAHGRKLQYYTETTIRNYLSDMFTMIYFKKYMEMIPDDSLLLILKKIE